MTISYSPFMITLVLTNRLQAKYGGHVITQNLCYSPLFHQSCLNVHKHGLSHPTRQLRLYLYIYTPFDTAPKATEVFQPGFHQEHSDMVDTPFLRLAAEIRNQIYHYLLSTEYTKQWPKEEDPVRYPETTQVIDRSSQAVPGMGVPATVGQKISPHPSPYPCLPIPRRNSKCESPDQP